MTDEPTIRQIFGDELADAMDDAEVKLRAFAQEHEDALEQLVAACERAYIPDEVDPEIGPFPDEEDVTSPPSGITFGMIRRAREALDGSLDGS